MQEVDESQQSMFDYIDDPDKPQYLNVLRDGIEPVKMDYEELFSNEYDRLECVTFSSSISFFDEICSRYKKATVIIGLPNDDFAKAQSMLFKHYQNVEGEKVFSHLSEESRNKFLERDIVALYPDKGMGTIHSKIYLLSNSQSNITRLIIGSANLSKQAFSTKVHQFEEVQFYDNDEKRFDVYKKRFDHIRRFTTSFFPEITLKNSTKEKVYIMLENEREEYKGEHIIKLLTNVNEVTELQDNIDAATIDIEDDNEAIRYMSVVVKNSTSGKGASIHLKTPQSLAKVIHKTEVQYSVSKNENETNRPFLIERPNHEGFDFSAESGSDLVGTPFAEKLDDDQIKEQMDVISQWIKSYENSLNITDDQLLDKQQHVFEYLLYCFSSPFLKDIRENVIYHNDGSDAVAQTIPMFAALAGVPSSGKTMHMNFVNKLMSGSNNIYDFTKYKFTARKLFDSSTTSNQYPLYIDEAKTVVFDGKSWVDKLKSIANNMDTKNAVIFTTNWDKFIIKPELRKRMYVIKLKYPFEEKKQTNASELLSKASPLLYKDFVYRFIEYMNEHDMYYKIDNNHVLDFLYVAREIFRKYFMIYEGTIPEWFPETTIDDLAELPMERWQSLYKFQIDEFKYNPTEDTISFRRDIAVNDKGDSKEIQSLMDYNIDLIPDRLMVNQRNSPFITVRAGKKTHDGFYDFIGLDEKGRKIGSNRSIWERLFK